MKKKTRKELKEVKRKLVQATRRQTGWKPPKGTIVYTDKY